MGHELPGVILEHRGLAKLRSTYTDKLPTMINPDTGRVHTSYHQAVAATGRLSSSDPNLQNIPVRTDEGRRIRQAFIPREGAIMVAADYSQIELRIMSHLSGDEALLRAFAEGQDIHRATAAEVFGAPLADVTDEHELLTGRRQEGIFFAARAFFGKLTTGLGHLLAGIGLDAIAFPTGSKPGELDPETLFQFGVLAGPLTLLPGLVSIAFSAKHGLPLAIVAGEASLENAREADERRLLFEHLAARHRLPARLLHLDAVEERALGTAILHRPQHGRGRSHEGAPLGRRGDVVRGDVDDGP